MALPIASAVWTLIGRSALLSVATRATAASFARDVAQDLFVRALERSITPSGMQTRLALDTPSNSAALDTEAGKVDLMGRMFEKVKERENRNTGSAYLAEMIAIHHNEGGKQKTASVLAMQAAATDDTYYPLLVYGANINSRPVSDHEECTYLAAAFYAYYYSEKQYYDVFVSGKEENKANLRNYTLNDRTAYEWAGRTWFFWKDRYSPRFGEVVDAMKNDPTWIRLGHFIRLLHQIMCADAGKAPGALLDGQASKYDVIAILNYAIDHGAVVMSDDRLYLGQLADARSEEAVNNIVKNFTSVYFKGAFITSIAGMKIPQSPTASQFGPHLNSIAQLSHYLMDPHLRDEVCVALSKLSEQIRRDIA